MSDSMWHEARRQERRIKGMLVDYRRRAERRRDFYERIKADPTQFLQVHGRQCKIHLDPSVAAAADSATAMMPWQGDPDNLIDRFDVRAHLDFIPVVKKDDEEELSQEERQLNYERYRIIAQNSFLALSEEKFLKQLHIEEQFGFTENKERRKERAAGVAIGFNYEEGGSQPQPQLSTDANDGDSEHSDSDLDVDLSINVSKMDPSEAHEMNRHGRNYGMSSNDFYSFLIKDLDEAESYRLAKEEEHEKALYAGRKSRRERRAHREKRLANRVISPPSYAARKSPDYTAFRQSKSPSKSPTPDNAGKITYITSFGDEEDLPPKPTYADKVRMGKPKKSDTNSCERTVYMAKSADSSKRKRSHSRGSRSRSRQRLSRERYRKHSRSRSRSKTRSSSSSRRPCRKRVYKGRKSRSSSSSSSVTISPKKRSRSTSSSSTSSSDEEPKTEKSKSESPLVKKESPPKQIPRYYGRRKSDQSSSELSDTDVNEKDNKEMSSSNKAGYGNSGTSFKKSTGTSMSASALSFQERLKRKRQALLNKQFKADKIAEMTKAEREKQEQQTREDELREMGIKLRKRQREKRHAYDSDSSLSTHSSTVRSRSPKKDTEENKSRSRSKSPQLKKEEPEPNKHSSRTEEPRETVHTRRKSPVRYEDKRTIHVEGRDGYNRDGYNRDGYNRDGYNRDGYNRDGYNRDGYNRDGYNRDRYNRDRTDRERRDEREGRYGRDRRDKRSRWDDRDRRDDRDKRDIRSRRDDRDRKDWRSKNNSRRDRYDSNSDNDSNSKSLRSLVDY